MLRFLLVHNVTVRISYQAAWTMLNVPVNVTNFRLDIQCNGPRFGRLHDNWSFWSCSDTSMQWLFNDLNLLAWAMCYNTLARILTALRPAVLFRRGFWIFWSIVWGLVKGFNGVFKLFGLDNFNYWAVPLLQAR